MTIALGAPELRPAIALELLLELDSLLDLVELDLDELVVFVTAGVGVSEDGKSLSILALGHQETWGLRDEPNGSLAGAGGSGCG